jgi:hypothetical protein
MCVLAVQGPTAREWPPADHAAHPCKRPRLADSTSMANAEPYLQQELAAHFGNLAAGDHAVRPASPTPLPTPAATGTASGDVASAGTAPSPAEGPLPARQQPHSRQQQQQQSGGKAMAAAGAATPFAPVAEGLGASPFAAPNAAPPFQLSGPKLSVAMSSLPGGGVPSLPRGLSRLSSGLPSLPSGLPSLPAGLSGLPSGLPSLPLGSGPPSLPSGVLPGTPMAPPQLPAWALPLMQQAQQAQQATAQQAQQATVQKAQQAQQAAAQQAQQLAAAFMAEQVAQQAQQAAQQNAAEHHQEVRGTACPFVGFVVWCCWWSEEDGKREGSGAGYLLGNEGGRSKAGSCRSKGRACQAPLRNCAPFIPWRFPAAAATQADRAQRGPGCACRKLPRPFALAVLCFHLRSQLRGRCPSHTAVQVVAAE